MSPRLSLLALACAAGLAAAPARATPLTFTSLGLTSGTPAQTEIFRADLSALGPGSLSAITITDAGSLAGALGRFSGFDLDAIVISSVLVTTASGIGALTSAAAFDIAAAVLTPGAQRQPATPQQPLFGSSGTGVNNAVATLTVFDGVPASDATATGFISLGDGGSLRLPLAAPLLLTGGPLYVYIGETGGGETATGDAAVVPPSTA